MYTTIARLRQILFGASTEKRAHVLKAVREAVKPDVPLSPPEDLDSVPSREGHGRNGAQAYAGATQIKVHHPSLNSGELCPECQRGKLYPDPRTDGGTVLERSGRAARDGALGTYGDIYLRHRVDARGATHGRSIVHRPQARRREPG